MSARPADPPASTEHLSTVEGTDTIAPPPSELLAAADLLDEAQAPTAWTAEARPQQLPTEGDWFVWLIMAGRGWGKTRTGAEWLANKARTVRGDYAVIARSSQDLRETCLEGQSGLLRASHADRPA